MQNQINVGDQNNQQIGQNPVNQPATIEEKPKINYWMISTVALVVVLVVISIFTFSLINNQKLISGTKITDTNLIPSAQPSTSTQAEQSIKWLNYTNEKYNFLKFKYPEGSTINFKEDTKNQIEGCFSLTLQYQEMILDVNRLCGIGGMPSLYDSPYTIIAGNDYEGIGKVVENDPNDQKKIHYFGYSNGAQQFGGFLIDTAGFNFKMPSSAQSKYEPIADVIATSTRNKVPNKQEVPAKMYRQEGAVIGVNSDKIEYTILKADSAKKERIETAIINPTGEYLAITIFIGQGPDSYLYLYNLNSKRVLEFAGQSRFPTIGNREVWMSDFVVVDADLNGYYKYDVKNLARTPIIQEEYTKLTTEKRARKK